MSRVIDRRWCAALALSFAAGACASAPPLAHQQCRDADRQLAALLPPLEALRAKGCGGAAPAAAADCDRLRIELERLAVICSTHEPTLMANAVVAYDDHEPIKSQQWLDQILSLPRTHPDAAALRA